MNFRRLAPTLTLVLATTLPVWAGTYNISFNLPDQILPFDIFGNPPATVLAPAGVYQGLSDDTVLQILGGNLVASDPTGGAAGEYSALALTAGPPTNAFTGGATFRCRIAGTAIAAVRDGAYPGLAIGTTMVDTASATYMFAAINRTTAGADYFDNITVGGVVNRGLLTPGTGYFAVWELNALSNATVLAVQPIPAGAIGDTEFRIDFNASASATFLLNGAAILTNHQLAAQPDRAGMVVMSWGTPAGNPPYGGVTLGNLHAEGPEIPDGGVPDLPASSPISLALLAMLIAAAAWRHNSLRPRRQRHKSHLNEII
ncbi:MAG: hypothetical protein HZB26_11780 [Candidatus Hydrogenedentes bacterium]|nr:hypothetical protein [Candidatus Hydrogenedentota bacterium]